MIDDVYNAKILGFAGNIGRIGRLNEPDGPFVTCCYAVLHVPTRRLHWAQARSGYF